MSASLSIDEVAKVSRWAAPWARWPDFIELTKPRIGLMVLCTVAVGAIAAAGDIPRGIVLPAVLIGVGLTAAGSSVFNQVIERDIDAKMARTARRPLPAGRVSLREAIVLGTVLSLLGLLVMALATPPLATALTLLSLALYVGAYTPLKQVSVFNTLVGAIPGALPAMIGWVAVTGTLAPEAWVLFGVVFFWQFPHFMAIAWMYREQYRFAGLRMLPSSERGRVVACALASSYCLALLPTSLWPAAQGLRGPIYFWGALALGLQYLGSSAVFSIRPSDRAARRLLWTSLAYLPGVLMLWTLDVVGRVN